MKKQEIIIELNCGDTTIVFTKDGKLDIFFKMPVVMIKDIIQKYLDENITIGATIEA